MQEKRAHEIECFTADLLSQVGVVAPPVDLSLVLAACDCILDVDRAMPEGMDGVVMAGWSLHLIRVNGRHPEARRRFTIAHEIGHLNMHVAEGYSCLLSSGARYVEEPEREANYFSACLLMPPSWMEADYIGNRLSLSRLAQRYHVSPSALMIRLRDLGLAYPEQGF